MNKDSTINQDIFLFNRKQLKITAVKKIISLNSLAFDIETCFGRLKIEGNNLDMISLDNDKGILLLNGIINKLEFLEKQTKKDKNILAKIFK